MRPPVKMWGSLWKVPGFKPRPPAGLLGGLEDNLSNCSVPQSSHLWIEDSRHHSED